MTTKRESRNQITCPWCNYTGEVIWVHGHGQCAACGINIDECCRGEQCGVEYVEQYAEQVGTHSVDPETEPFESN